MGAALLTASLWSTPLRGQPLPTLKLSLPPMIDSFPIAFAHDQQIFADHGVAVELLGIPDRTQRNVALFSGAVDGALADVASVLQLIAADTPIKITSTAYEVIDESRRYALMTHHFSNIKDLNTLLSRLDGKNRRTIGLLRRTDIEFETDRLITRHGVTLDPSQQYADQENLVLLATLLAQGSMLAAVLPEPMGSYLEFITRAEGLPVVALADYRDQKLVPSVLAFETALIEQDPSRIERFYNGYREVLSTLATLPRQQVIEIGVDAALQFFFPGLRREELPPGAENFIRDYLIPAFPQPRALATEEFQTISDWAQGKGYLRKAVPFELAFTNLFNGS
jgi:NitT/TauT family transport system substrate-binding protein